MMHYEFGDILLLRVFPYSNLEASKKRPALVLADIGDQDLVVCRITSEPPRNVFDQELRDWKEHGLLVASSVRISKVATLSKGLVLKKLGRLGSPERRTARSILKKLFLL